MKKVLAATLETVAIGLCLLTATMVTAEEKGTFSVLSYTDNISVSGLLEVEAGFSEDFKGIGRSDLTLATMELGIDAQIHDWLSAHVLFLWEKDDTEPVDLDEGFITIGDTAEHPIYLRAGKMYVPFGVFETNMVSDPLTLEIGETRESAALIGAEFDGFYGSVYAFNGDISEDGDQDDMIESFGVNAGYIMERDDFIMDAGIDWLSNLIDSDGLGDGFGVLRSEYITDNPEGSFELKEYTAGMGAHLKMIFGPFYLVAEYIGAIDDPEFTIDDGGGGAVAAEILDAPGAFHVEGAYRIGVMEKDVTLAMTYQRTDNLAGILPEARYGASIGVGVTDYMGIALEYLHDEDYNEHDGGTDESAETFTMQLALEF